MRLDIGTKLNELKLNPGNAVVIGSGILNALNLRKSKDIDVVVSEEKYKELVGNSRFKKGQNHGREILVDSLFEIGTSWVVLDKIWKLNDLLSRSIVIDGVRYNTVDFLLDVKRCWVADGDGRQKDIDDIKLIEQHFPELKK